MNRTDLLELDQERTRRVWSGRPIELRASSSGSTLTFDGYASVTEESYTVYGGAPYGWDETIANGAFKRTLQANADVAFLINHDGMTLARTKSGTLKLSEDKTGLRAVADLDPRSNVVNDLQVAVERGDVDEMSFGFRVVKDEWTDSEGQPSSQWDGVNRRILEVNMNKGDVSAVNYGANPATSAGFRGVDVALAELRAGRPLNDKQRDLVRSLAHVLDEAPEQLEARMEHRDDQSLLDALRAIELAVVALRAEVEQDVADDSAGADGTVLPGENNSADRVSTPEVVSALRSLWDMRVDAA